MRRWLLLAVLLATIAVAVMAMLARRPQERAVHTMTALPTALRGGPMRVKEGVRMSVRTAPVPARVGSRIAYRGDVVIPRGVQGQFGRPEPGGEFTWSEVSVRRKPGRPASQQGTPIDTLVFEAVLQVFETGAIAIPGPGLRLESVPWRTGPFVTRLPVARFLVLPTVTDADSAASLRGLRGPSGAPWWERVAWGVVAAGILLLAALVALVVWARRRPKRAQVPPAKPVAAVPRPDAAAEALAALAALRQERLPEQGRYADHAFALTRILRRWLERTRSVPRPGDTSAELVQRLRTGGAPAEELDRLSGLLAVWDRLKFARALSSVEEAGRTELSVESVIRGGRREEGA